MYNDKKWNKNKCMDIGIPLPSGEECGLPCIFI